MPDPVPFGVGGPAEPMIESGLPGVLSGIMNFPKHLIDQAAQFDPNDIHGSTARVAPAAAEMALALAGGSSAVPATANELRMGIKAYHGSPYDFDKFDISKLKTGEGAQSYGSGLYFAENPAVAKDYRDSLSAARMTFNDQPMMVPSDIKHFFPNEDWRVHYPMEHALGNIKRGASLEEAIATMRKEYPHYEPQDIDKAEKFLRSGNPTNRGRGRLYEVDIDADPKAFLDWYQSRASQTPEVNNVLTQVNPKTHELPGTMFPPSMQGSDIYSTIANKQGYSTSAGREPNYRKASEILNASGMPGIKYLDRGSRVGLRDGTHNYVTFNDDIVKILKKE
jgi:hypothetical protein